MPNLLQHAIKTVKNKGMTENLPEKVPASEIIFYQTEDGQSRMSVRLENETVWLTQAAMAELFQRDKSVISRHIRNIFGEGKLAPDSVVANYAITADDGENYRKEATIKEYLIVQ